VQPWCVISREIESRLPSGCTADDGVARSFPPGGDRLLNTGLTKGQSIRRVAETEAKTDRLLNELFAMVHKSGILTRPTARSRQASATVKSILSKTRGRVLLDSGEWATSVHEITYPEVPLDWPIQIGQRVTGSPTHANLLE
jgi:hypothetical protein